MNKSLGDRVFTAVQARANGGAESTTAYANMAVELPALIRFNGLRSTLAYLQEKGKEEEKGREKEKEGIRNLLEDFLSIRGDVGGATLRDLLCSDGAKALLQEILSMEGERYRLITRLAYSQAEWFKRFAESELVKDQSETMPTRGTGR